MIDGDPTVEAVVDLSSLGVDTPDPDAMARTSLFLLLPLADRNLPLTSFKLAKETKPADEGVAVPDPPVAPLPPGVAA